MTDDAAGQVQRADGGAGIRSRGRSARRVLTIVLLLVAAILFVCHARIYWDWTEDDAFISFRYAYNVAHGRGFVFNPGERVEGYSNFAWVLLASLAIRAGFDPVTVAKVVGVVAGLGALFLSWVLARRIAPRSGLITLVAPFYLAISPVLVRHSITGLETSCFAFLVVAGVLLASGPPRPLTRFGLIVVLLLLGITRCEGPFVALTLLVVRALGPRLAGGWMKWSGAESADSGGSRDLPPRSAGVERAAWIDASVVIGLFALYLVWRWSYFGDLFPNTFYAKARGGPAGLVDGAQYTLDFMRDGGGPLFFSLALVPFALGAVRRPAYWLGLAVCAAYLIFVLASGGDWMFHYRFYAHVLPVLGALVAAGLGVLLALPRPGTLRALAVYALMAVVLAATYASMGNTELRIARAVLPALENHDYFSQNYEELGLWFRENTPPGASIAISDIGAIGYFSERRIIDMFGLIDPHIAGLPGRLHFKADAAYVLARRPDYIVLVSCRSDDAGYPFQRIPDRRMNESPAFHAGYELIRTVPQHWQNEHVMIYRRRAAAVGSD